MLVPRFKITRVRIGLWAATSNRYKNGEYLYGFVAVDPTISGAMQFANLVMTAARTGKIRRFREMLPAVSERSFGCSWGGQLGYGPK